MYKAGATYRDKNRIRGMVAKGMGNEQISSITRVKPDHVEAIVKQIKEGTLKGSRAESKDSGGSYGEEEGSTGSSNEEPKTDPELEISNTKEPEETSPPEEILDI